MTNPDYRALCAELVDDLELCDWPYKLKDTIRADIERARAALATKPRIISRDRDETGPYVVVAESEGTDGEVPRIGHILRLAEIIREVDGKHDKGAAALAEAILSHPGIRSAGLTATLLQQQAAPVPEPGEVHP